MNLENRVEKLETITRRNIRKIGTLSTFISAVYLALRHPENEKAQRPLKIALVTLMINDIIDIVTVINHRR